MGSTLTAVTTPTMDGAEALLSEVAKLQQQNLIVVDDAAIVVRDHHGNPKIKQAKSLVGEGALGGAFWGMLIGLLFLVPWLGAAVGAATGALSGKAADFGIDDDFIKTVGNRIDPNTSALFLLTHDAVLDKVADAVRGYDFEIVHTNLPEDQEAKIRAAFE